MVKELIFTIGMTFAPSATDYGVDSCGMAKDSHNHLHQAFTKNGTFYIKEDGIEQWKRIDLIRDFNLTGYFPVECQQFMESY